MDKKDDVTLQVLIDIREEIRGTNQRVETLTTRVDKLTTRVDNLEVSTAQGFADLAQRITHSEIRVATAVNEVVGSVNDVKHMLREQLDLRDRVTKCEVEIAKLKGKKKPD